MYSFLLALCGLLLISGLGGSASAKTRGG